MLTAECCAAGGCLLVKFRTYSFLAGVLLLAAGATSLSFAQTGASLHGAIIVPSGSPVAQAIITVEGTGGGQTATSNADGQYSMSGLAPGAYSVKISAPGYETFEVMVSLSEGVNKEVDAVLMAKPPEPAHAEPAPVPSQSGAEAPAAAAQTQAEQATGQKGNAALA